MTSRYLFLFYRVKVRIAAKIPFIKHEDRTKRNLQFLGSFEQVYDNVLLFYLSNVFHG